MVLQGWMNFFLVSHNDRMIQAQIMAQVKKTNTPIAKINRLLGTLCINTYRDTERYLHTGTWLKAWLITRNGTEIVMKELKE